jgi:hypothetical protein
VQEEKQNNLMKNEILIHRMRTCAGQYAASSQVGALKTAELVDEAANELKRLIELTGSLHGWLPAIDQTIDALKEDASPVLRADSIGRMEILAEFLRKTTAST